MMSMQCATIAAALLLLSPLLQASAQDSYSPPTDGPAAVVDWPATLSSPPSTGITLDSLRIDFERTSLSDVRNAVGVGHISRQGDAGDSVTWLCYTLPAAQGASRLWLTSGEMGGGRYITEVSIRMSNAFTPRPACPLLPKRFRAIEFDRSLHANNQTYSDGFTCWEGLRMKPMAGTCSTIAHLKITASANNPTGFGSARPAIT